MPQLQDGGAERAYGVQDTVVTRVYAVKPKPQTAHVELTFGELLYTGRIVHVTQYAVVEG